MTTPAATVIQSVLGVPFYIGDFAGLLQRTRQGGLIAVPSAPVLVGLIDDPAHRAAVEGADLAITDSGFMVLLWRLCKGQKLPRYSGLKYIRALLLTPDFKKAGSTFWVMPTIDDAAGNLSWLKGQGFALSEADTYIAPMYPRTGTLSDPALLAAILARRPTYVMLNLGGGVQERLGFYLREALASSAAQLSALSDQRPVISNQPTVSPSHGSAAPPSHRPTDTPSHSLIATPPHGSSHPPYRPAIICTGAAIAFLSGRQAGIPVWADRMMLGWLLRSLRDPGRFLPRYWAALRLAPLLWKHGERSVDARS